MKKAEGVGFEQFCQLVQAGGNGMFVVKDGSGTCGSAAVDLDYNNGEFTSGITCGTACDANEHCSGSGGIGTRNLLRTDEANGGFLRGLKGGKDKAGCPQENECHWKVPVPAACTQCVCSSAKDES